MGKERDLKPVEMIYIGVISQKKPSYGDYKNWVLIQECDTKDIFSFFMNTKEDLSEKDTPFLKKIKTMKKTVKIISFYNAGENKILEGNCMKNFN